MNETNLIIITAIQLIMKIIIDGELLVQQRSILRVMKKEITIITKIARILRSPFVIHTHLRSSVYLTYTTFLNTRLMLKCQYWISPSSSYIILLIKQSHISNHNRVLAISLPQQHTQKILKTSSEKGKKY